MSDNWSSIESVSRRNRKSYGKYCSIVGCSNNSAMNVNVPPEQKIRFFSFPSASRNNEQRLLWVNAVSRLAPDGSSWSPSPYSVICQAHFVGGKPSPTRGHPDYVPSQFPKQYKKKSFSPAALDRHNRAVKRQRGSFENQADVSFSASIANEEHKYRDFSVQAPDTITEKVKPQLRVTFELKSMVCTVKAQAGPRLNTFDSECNINMEALETTDQFAQKNRSIQATEMSLNFGIQFLRSDQEWKAYTGMEEGFFFAFLELLEDDLKASQKLKSHDKLLLFLVKMKLNLSFICLGTLFQISNVKASEVFKEVLDISYKVCSELVYWPSKDQIRSRMPSSFKKYENCRAIIDCTEIETECPEDLEMRTLFWSNYKQRHTLKFLIAIAPSGEITFVSKAFGGRATDSQITNKSGFLHLLEAGDVILADKGFPQIIPDANNKGAFVITPPFKPSGRNQLTDKQNNECYNVACVRVHVERAIRRLKYFEILSFVPRNLVKDMSKVIIILAFFCNNMNELINTD